MDVSHALTNSARVGLAQLQSNASTSPFGARDIGVVTAAAAAAFRRRITVISKASYNPTVLATHPYNSAETQFSPDKRKTLQKAEPTGEFRAPNEQQPSAQGLELCPLLSQNISA